MADGSLLVGRGHIEITPRLAKGFDEQLREQLARSRGSENAGQDLGRRVGGQFSTGLTAGARERDSLGRFVSESGRTVEPAGQKLGSRVGGQFSAGLTATTYARDSLGRFVSESGHKIEPAGQDLGRRVGGQFSTGLTATTRARDSLGRFVSESSRRAEAAAQPGGSRTGQRFAAGLEQAAAAGRVGLRIGSGLTAGLRVGFVGAQVGGHVYRALNQAMSGAEPAGRTMGGRLLAGAGLALRIGDRGLEYGIAVGVRRAVSAAAAPLIQSGQRLAGWIGIGLRAGSSVVQAAIGPLIAGVPAEVIGLGVQLAAAIAPAAGALLALPAAAVAAAQGLGVAKLAFSGVTEALSAHAAAAKTSGGAATSNANALAAAADAVVSARERVAQAYQQAADRADQANRRQATAERQLARAQQDARDAQIDLTQARKDAARQLDDLRTQVERSGDAEAAARIRVKQAQLEEQQVLKNRRSTTLQRAEAALAVREAQANLDDTLTGIERNKQALAEQSSAGVEGSDRVVAAQERIQQANESVADAQQALADAQRDIIRSQEDGARGIADAQRALAAALRQQAAAAQASGGATNQYAQALAKLPPPARDFVQQLVGMSPLLDKLKGSAAGVFPGMSSSLRQLATDFPVVDAGVTKTAAGLSRVAASIGPAFSGPAFQGELTAVMDANARSTEAWGHSAVSVARGLWSIVTAGAPIVARESELGAKLAENLRLWLKTREENGTLARWMNRGIGIAKQLFRIVEDVGRGILNVFHAAPTGGVLDGIERIAAGFARITGSAGGQNRIAQFFSIVDRAANRASTAVAGFFHGLSSGQSNATGFAGFFERAGAGVNHLVDLLSHHLWPLLQDIGSVFHAAGAPARAFANALSGGGKGGGLGAGIDKLHEQLAPAFADLKTFFADLTPVMERMGRTLVGVVLPVFGIVGRTLTGTLIAGFRAFAWTLAHVVGPALVWFSGQSGGTQRAILVLVGGLVLLRRWGYTLGELRRLFAGLRDARNLIAAGRHLAGLARGLQALAGFAFRMNPLVRAFRGLIGVFNTLRTVFNLLRLAFLSNPFGIILIAAVALGIAFYELYKHSETFRHAVQAVGRFFARIGGDIWDGIKKVPELFGKMWDAIKAIFSSAWNWIHDAAVGAWDGIRTVFSSVIDAIKWVFQTAWDGIKLVFSTAWSWIHDAATGAWDGIQRVFTDVIDAIKWVFQHEWDAIRFIFTAAWNGIHDSGVAIWNVIKDFFTGALDGFKNFFQRAVDGIKDVWNGLKEVLSIPVRFYVNTIYNKGIRWAWNNTVARIGIPELPELHVDGLKTGGPVRGPGGPRDDKAGLFALSNDEYVMPAQSTRHYGLPFMEAIRRRDLPRDSVPGLAGGGLVGKAWDATGGKVVSGANDLLRSGAAAVADGVFAPLRSAIIRLFGDGDDWKGVISKAGRFPLDKIIEFIRGKETVSDGTATGNRALGQRLAQEIYNWTGGQWTALEHLWTGESGWNHLAENPSSGAYGIPQALPGSKMASAGANWRSDPATQIRWGLGYIHDRSDYGDPQTAFAKWSSRTPHWYDAGGWLGPGEIAVNGTGRPEAVLDPEESAALKAALHGSRGGRGPLVSIGAVHVQDKTDVDLLAQKLDFYQRKGGF
ncbi:hypothetical protein [Frankia sp. Cr1]|uniref:aggregation-promoting factor C-terminal-like domain-containing protein n=1 Tax=Frankia sp. Cr1 TaxID=3073931 RepID=UPI002AD52F31|nr:hypothetical protein [Frankia sp. Cr1]